MQDSSDEWVTRSISMPRTLAGAIDAAAQDRYVNRSQLIRDAMRIWLRMNGYPLALEPAQPIQQAS